MNTSSKIIYSETRPHARLTPYIDAFWMAMGNNNISTKDRILPDGCADIILNLGTEFSTDNGTTTMQSHHAYLVGTMTQYKEVARPSGTKLIGIRFKPGGMSFFYDSAFLKETANKTVEFDHKLIPVINETTSAYETNLNRFFINRLSNPKRTIFSIINDITNVKGQVSVADLAKRHFISIRQLERQFRQDLGISPKEFINFVRYRSAFNILQNNRNNKSLLHIAFENGYYDHAHLTNEIKKYTGITPSQL
jgi:AraC-like DNA-binding protein